MKSKTKLFQRILSIVLVGIFMFASTIPANAQIDTNTNTNNAKIVYTNENGNQVVEADNNNGEKSYIIVAKGKKVNDLSDETKLKELASKNINNEVIGERWYLAFANDLEKAKEIAKQDASQNIASKYSIQASYFWGQGSYVESYWNLNDGFSKHVHLVPVDVTAVQNTGLTVAALIGYAMFATGVLTGGGGAVLGAVIAIKIIVEFRRGCNSDGSLDIYSTNSLRNEHKPVYGGDYLGKFRDGTGVFTQMWWPISAPIVNF